MYDAILVEEAQDFNLDWWQLLRGVFFALMGRPCSWPTKPRTFTDVRALGRMRQC
jgi:hypothetical protein